MLWIAELHELQLRDVLPGSVGCCVEAYRALSVLPRPPKYPK